MFTVHATYRSRQWIIEMRNNRIYEMCMSYISKTRYYSIKPCNQFSSRKDNFTKFIASVENYVWHDHPSCFMRNDLVFISKCTHMILYFVSLLFYQYKIKQKMSFVTNKLYELLFTFQYFDLYQIKLYNCGHDNDIRALHLFYSVLQ